MMLITNYAKGTVCHKEPTSSDPDEADAGDDDCGKDGEGGSVI